jgi:glycosyltransferase involved in cell wall biosynthesis
MIGPEVNRIYLVDDYCLDKSGDFTANHCTDRRVAIVRHEQNQGVGGAALSGYQAAIADCLDVIVKIDGDGQMDPTLNSVSLRRSCSAKRTMQRATAFSIRNRFMPCQKCVRSAMPVCRF